MPIIGKKKESQKLHDLQVEEEKKYQGEMAKLLVEWQIDNDTNVEAILVSPQTNSTISFMSLIKFSKMTNDQKNDLKNKLIQSENGTNR